MPIPANRSVAIPPSWPLSAHAQEVEHPAAVAFPILLRQLPKSNPPLAADTPGSKSRRRPVSLGCGLSIPAGLIRRVDGGEGIPGGDGKQPHTCSMQISQLALRQTSTILSGSDSRNPRSKYVRTMRTKSSRSGKKRRAAPSPKGKKKASGAGTRLGLRSISRLEKSPKAAAGWRVGIVRRGKSMYKHFADSKCGGKAKALSAAKAWRDKVLKSASDVDYVLWRRQKRSRPSSSGIIGVGRYEVQYQASRHPVWEASWQDADGKRHSRRFFISVHGEKGAKARACAARREAMAELRKELIRRGVKAR
ncbi:MAG TPA: AP2 domain-containing protein [Rhizomicrobium sp.]|nr:AP2 domain-containing protein [Rhizomicrobium sp.]